MMTIGHLKEARDLPDQSNWKQIQNLFEQALELPEEARGEFLRGRPKVNKSSMKCESCWRLTKGAR